MRICSTCGEVYEDSARACALDGTSLTSWEENTRLPFGVEDVVTDAGIQDVIRAQLAEQVEETRRTTPLPRVLAAHVRKTAAGIEIDATDPHLDAMREHPQVAAAVVRSAADPGAGSRATEPHAIPAEERLTAPFLHAYRRDPRVAAAFAPTPATPAGLAAAPGGAASEPRAGRSLGNRYTLQRQIGIGGFGAVFEGIDTRLQKRVAIKILSPHVARNPDALARFRREAIAASQIGHEGIVDVTDFDADSDGAMFIVMEYLDGLDLAQVIEHDRRLPPVRALTIAIQASHALGAAHRKGILHRDLKPANIYLTNRESRDDFVKVIDFGISKVLHQHAAPSSLTNTGQIIGTPYYMSPEQATGDREIDGRADIYALAVILYEMLTGHPPFLGKTYLAVITKHLHEYALPPSALVPDLPLAESLDAVVTRALSKAPEDRYPTMASFGDAMLAILSAIDPLAASAVYPRRLRSDPGLSGESPICLPESREHAYALTVTAMAEPVADTEEATIEDDAGDQDELTTTVRPALDPSVVTIGGSVGRLLQPVDRHAAPNRRWIWWLASGAAIAGLLTAVLLVALGSGSDTGASILAPSPARQQRITVLSSVASAEFRDENGAYLGHARVAVDAPEGDEVVRLTIRAPGYEEESVRIDATSNAEVFVTLRRKGVPPEEGAVPPPIRQAW